MRSGHDPLYSLVLRRRVRDDANVAHRLGFVLPDHFTDDLRAGLEFESGRSGAENRNDDDSQPSSSAFANVFAVASRILSVVARPSP
jgi:hypothetical protein